MSELRRKMSTDLRIRNYAERTQETYIARVAEMAVVFPLALIAVASGTFSPFLYYQF